MEYNPKCTQEQGVRFFNECLFQMWFFLLKLYVCSYKNRSTYIRYLVCIIFDFKIRLEKVTSSLKFKLKFGSVFKVRIL